MSDRLEPSGSRSKGETTRRSTPNAPDRRSGHDETGPGGSLDLIACDGCGRTFVTTDGPGMMAAIVGPCPDCGGRFQLADTLPRGMQL